MSFDPDVRWIVSNAPEDKARAYAYSTTAVVSSSLGEGYGPLTLLVVTGRAGRADVASHAGWQADRLRSGLYVAVVTETYAQAWEVARRALQDGDWSPVAV